MRYCYLNVIYDFYYAFIVQNVHKVLQNDIKRDFQ